MQGLKATESTAKKREPALAMLGLALLAVYALLAYQIWDSYRSEIERAELTTRNYAATFETRLDTTFRHADRIILALVRTLPPEALIPAEAPRFKRDLVAELDSRLVNFDELANLRILEIDHLHSVPGVPASHPFIKRLIGTIRREFLDHTLFWDEQDLVRKLAAFTDYHTRHRAHSGLRGRTPAKAGGALAPLRADLLDHGWKSLCNGLFPLPSAA